MPITCVPVPGGGVGLKSATTLSRIVLPTPLA